MSDKLIEDDLARGVPEMRRRHLAIALRMQAVATHALQELEQKIAHGQPLNMTADEAQKLRDAGLELEKAARPSTAKVLATKPN